MDKLPKTTIDTKQLDRNRQIRNDLDSLTTLFNQKGDEPVRVDETLISFIDDTAVDNGLSVVERLSHRHVKFAESFEAHLAAEGDAGSARDIMRMTLASKRANDLWRNGMEIAATREDVNTWHLLATDDSFHRLQEWYIDYEGSAWRSLQQSAGAGAVFHKIAEVSEGDGVYLDAMADFWVSQLPPRHQGDRSSLQKTAQGMLREVHTVIPGAATDFRLRDLTGEFEAVDDKAVRLAAAIYRKADVANPLPTTQGAALKLIRDVKVEVGRGSYFQGLNDHLLSLVDAEPGSKKNPERDPNTYFAAASGLLMKSLKLASDPQGLHSEHARIMYQFLEQQSSQQNPFADIRTARRPLIALANGLTGTINESLPTHMALEKVSGQSGEDLYDAFDRVLYVLGQSISHDESAEADVIRDVSECITTLVQFGAPHVRKSETLVARSRNRQ